MELLEESSHDYDSQPTDMDPSEGIIEENPPTNHKNDVSMKMFTYMFSYILIV